MIHTLKRFRECPVCEDLEIRGRYDSCSNCGAQEVQTEKQKDVADIFAYLTLELHKVWGVPEDLL